MTVKTMKERLIKHNVRSLALHFKETMVLGQSFEILFFILQQWFFWGNRLTKFSYIGEVDRRRETHFQLYLLNGWASLRAEVNEFN